VSKEVRAIFRSVHKCRQCYGDRCGIVVTTPETLPDTIRVVVIGEQPPREGNGAAPTGEEADYLRTYLDRAGVDPATVLFVTAVLCHPEMASLRPGRPSATEVRNCSQYLRQLLTRVNPKLIVPVGHSGLLALQFAMNEWTELRQFILNYDVGAVLTRKDCTVYPLYLPSPSTLKARPEGRQLRDWQKIPQLLESLERAARG